MLPCEYWYCYTDVNYLPPHFFVSGSNLLVIWDYRLRNGLDIFILCFYFDECPILSMHVFNWFQDFFTVLDLKCWKVAELPSEWPDPPHCGLHPLSVYLKTTHISKALRTCHDSRFHSQLSQLCAENTKVREPHWEESGEVIICIRCTTYHRQN